MKLNDNIVRQGDVTLVRVNDDGTPPRWAKPAKRVDGRVDVELGERTGHGHRLRGPHTSGFRVETAEMAERAGLDFVAVGGSGDVMRHEHSDGRPAEHDETVLHKGGWERAVQVDADAEGIRRVAD